jgi:hypothetical protein
VVAQNAAVVEIGWITERHDHVVDRRCAVDG